MQGFGSSSMDFSARAPEGGDLFVEWVKHVDMRVFVIHHCSTMKTATVRDLRNHFADLTKWIEQGEPVTITRRGVVIAMLSPVIRPELKKADWTARFNRFSPVGPGISKKASEKLWADLRD